MDLYRKNLEYSYHYVEPDTAHSLLYAKARDDCVTLDPIATALWKESGELIDLDLIAGDFARVFGIDDAAGYLTKIAQGMCRAGALDVLEVRPSEDQERGRKRRNSEESSYLLEAVNFYVTEECNAKCWHCYQPTIGVANSAQPVRAEQVDCRTFLRFIESAVPLGLRSVKLTGGEPLLRADIEDLVKGLSGLGLALCVESNGFLVTERLADLLAREVQLVAISIDGGSADRHDRLRRLPGSFDRATRSMSMLSSEGGNVQAIMTLSRLNVSDLEATIAAAAGAGCRSFKINILVTLGGARHLENSRALLDLREILDVYGRARELETKYGIHVYIDGPPCFASIRDAFENGVGACQFTNLLGVLADGSISYCGIGNSCRELIFGNMRDADFDVNRFWNETPQLLEARRALSRKVDGICGQCVFEASCKGSCRAFAYSEFGSLQGPHPWCQKAVEAGFFPPQYLVPTGADQGIAAL